MVITNTLDNSYENSYVSWELELFQLPSGCQYFKEARLAAAMKKRTIRLHSLLVYPRVHHYCCQKLLPPLQNIFCTVYWCDKQTEKKHIKSHICECQNTIVVSHPGSRYNFPVLCICHWGIRQHAVFFVTSACDTHVACSGHLN